MIKDAIKRFGLIGFLENTLIHCLQKIGVDFCIMEMFYLEIPEVTEDKQGIDVRVLQLSDFESQVNKNPIWFTPQKIEDMKRAFSLDGNVPVGIFEEELILAYGWISLKTFGIEKIALKGQDGYLWDDYTHPDYRGRGLHSVINNARVNFLRSCSKHRVLTHIAHYNRASRIGYLRNGFKFGSRWLQIKVGKYMYSSFKYNHE